MSDVIYTPPPPPPPPPPAPAPAASFDFTRPFAFVFEDPRWVTKILIGGLFQIAAIFVIGIFFVLGYCAQVARNVIAGLAAPLPEWEDLGGYFAEGLRLAGVVFVYTIPFIAIFVTMFVPAILMTAGAGAMHRDVEGIANALGGGVMTCAWCLAIPLGLALAFWLPGALLFAVVDRRFGAAFEFGRIWAFIRGNLANYLIAFVIYLIVRFAAGFGLLLFCVGVFFTAFWAFLVATYAFAEAYRLSSTRP